MSKVRVCLRSAYDFGHYDFFKGEGRTTYILGHDCRNFQDPSIAICVVFRLLIVDARSVLGHAIVSFFFSHFPTSTRFTCRNKTQRAKHKGL